MKFSRKAVTNELYNLALTAEEGFVLSRLDTALTSTELTELTGLPADRVATILAFLEDKGLVESDVPTRPTMETIPDAEYTEEQEEENEAAKPLATEWPPLVPLVHEQPEEPELPRDSEEADLPADNDADVDNDTDVNDEVEVDDEVDVEENQELPIASEPPPPEDSVEQIAQTASSRKVYEYELRSLARDKRIAMATREKAPDLLLALCFDPDAAVVRALLANALTGLTHARLVAEHHRNPLGLEAVVQRKELAVDGRVQRMLLRNVQLSEGLAKHVLSPKSMIQVYKTSVDTDVPERTRAHARVVLRTKFIGAQGEERAGLIFATEGRVLPALAGLTFDGRTTSMLCGRTYTSVLFVRNLARFSSCPPLLLAHLMKQTLVKRSPQLKMMLLQHPNMPAETKRREG